MWKHNQLEWNYKFDQLKMQIWTLSRINIWMKYFGCRWLPSLAGLLFFGQISNPTEGSPYSIIKTTQLCLCSVSVGPYYLQELSFPMRMRMRMWICIYIILCIWHCELFWHKIYQKLMDKWMLNYIQNEQIYMRMIWLNIKQKTI